MPIREGREAQTKDSIDTVWPVISIVFYAFQIKKIDQNQAN